MKEVITREHRYFVDPKELACKLGIDGKIKHISWNSIESGRAPDVTITTAEVVRNDFTEGE